MKNARTMALSHRQLRQHKNRDSETEQQLIQELIYSPLWDCLSSQARQRWLQQLQDLSR